MMNIYNPWHLALLAVLIPLLGIVLGLRKRRMNRFRRFAEEPFAGTYLTRLSPFYSTLKLVLAVLALAFAVLALARPQWDYEQREFQTQGLDIMICLDISKSMDAADMAPTRLMRAKLQIASFIGRLDGDRIGIVAFAGKAALECPLTDDYESVKLVLNSLTTDSAVEQGTDIAAALELAQRAFSAAAGSNILILISDGEELAGSAVQQAAKLAAVGVKVYTMGVGSAEGSRIYDQDSGREATTKLDVKSLERIASAGGGRFYSVTPGQSELDLILQNVYATEKGAQRSKNFRSLKEQYHIFAFIALFLLVLESMILPLRKPREQT
jgi:Ca-activated chloride channel family protein